MSSSATLNPVAAALPQTTEKAASAREAASDDFSAVLQQKITQPSSKPADNEQKQGKEQVPATTAAQGTPAAPETTAKQDADAEKTAIAEVTPQPQSDNRSDLAGHWLPPVLALIGNTPDNANTQSAKAESQLLQGDAPDLGLIQSLVANMLSGATQATQTQAPKPDNKPGFANELPTFSLTTTQSAASETTDLLQLAEDGTANVAAPQLGEAQAVRTLPQADAAGSTNFAHVLASTGAELQAKDSGTTSSSHTIQAPLRNPADIPAWSSEIGDRMVWMSRQQESKAELVLTPPQLGKVEVSLNINGDQASVSFVSANPQVRDALESAINRLRESFAENGINLGQTHVGSESAGQQFAQSGRSAQRTQGDAESHDPLSTPLAWHQQGNSMVDVFA